MELKQHVTAAAWLALGQWSQRLGDDGMAAMRTRPGLAAAVDQHVMQIREAIGLARPEALAAYADGVADAVTAKGWTADETASGWEGASWPSLHLLAVCVVASKLS
ncbi:DUF6401 family natural product biosynthesis protein [Actinoplanes sp. NPDC049596]|uniref:DUF6401 family natural product biosynthesis protein n=1 Tax=unclassified Actinoplanes TaxID=2626549 RepID=UPI0034406F53